MVEALVRGLEGGGDNGGYIPGMCSDHSLVASHSRAYFFFISFWTFRKFGAIFSLQVYKLEFLLRLLQITLLVQEVSKI